jgi:hypothetical protein
MIGVAIPSTIFFQIASILDCLAMSVSFHCLIICQSPHPDLARGFLKCFLSHTSIIAFLSIIYIIVFYCM